MHVKRLLITTALLCNSTLFLVAQEQTETRTFMNAPSWNYSVGLGADVPMADLADRFGTNMAFKAQIERQTSSDWLFSFQFDFMFGNTVKEDIFDYVRLDNGQILGANNTYAVVLQRMRGAFMGVGVGKVINLSSKYRSGLKVSLSAGVFGHHVRLIDDERSFPQLDGDYKKGLDRMTRGIGLKQFVGWQYLSDNNRINLYAGFEFTQGFTSAVRDFDFDRALPSDQNARLDGAVGLRVGFIVPFYGGYEDEEVFY